MGVTLQLLERDRVGPQNADRAAIGAQRGLRQVARFGVPFGMLRAGIVPIHQQGFITRVAVNADKAAGIGLLVDESQSRPRAEQAFIDFMPNREVLRHHACRHQGADKLRVARTNQFGFAFRNQIAKAWA